MVVEVDTLDARAVRTGVGVGVGAAVAVPEEEEFEPVLEPEEDPERLADADADADSSQSAGSTNTQSVHDRRQSLVRCSTATSIGRHVQQSVPKVQAPSTSA